MKALTENNFTSLGTQQFVEHTRLITTKVKDVIRNVNPVVKADTALADAIVKMTEYGYGCVTVVNASGQLVGVFTDGDLRRRIQAEGRDVLNHKIGDFQYKQPISVDANSLLNEAADVFKKNNVDTLLVTDGGKPVGMLDIQDI
jgi:transaldolase